MPATPSDSRPTSVILADDKSLSAILEVGMDPAADLNPHPADGPSDGDSYYIVSYLQDNGHKFTVLFHLMLLNKPSPPGPLALLGMSVLDDTADPPYFSKEVCDIGKTKTTVPRGPLDIRMVADDKVTTLGHLAGTMDQLTVEGHATDSSSNSILDIELQMTAIGPTFNYLGSGVIPFPGGKDYEYAFPYMTTTGTLTVKGNRYEVTGTSWLDREWGHVGPAKWTWMSIQLDNGVQLGLWDEQPYDKSDTHVGGRAFATIQEPDGGIFLSTVSIVETSFWTSADGKRKYANSWTVTIPAPSGNAALPARAVLSVETVVDGQEINSNSPIPRLEAKCRVDGEYGNTPVKDVNAFVEVGNIPLLPPA
jgi:hypothetical protein